MARCQREGTSGGEGGSGAEQVLFGFGVGCKRSINGKEEKLSQKRRAHSRSVAGGIGSVVWASVP